MDRRLHDRRSNSAFVVSADSSLHAICQVHRLLGGQLVARQLDIVQA